MNKEEHIFLTYSDEEKLPYACAYLRKIYSSLQGLQLHFKKNDIMQSVDFVIQRQNKGITNCAVGKVRSGEIISAEHVRELNNYAGFFENSHFASIDKIFMVHVCCDISGVPEDFKIIYLNNTPNN
jgi:hypothetical protein